jgi:hypothetical protein
MQGVSVNEQVAECSLHIGEAGQVITRTVKALAREERFPSVWSEPQLRRIRVG